MKKILLTTLLGLAVSVTACGKKDDAAKTDDKTAKPAADMKTADKPADKMATPPAAGGEMTAADYEAKDVKMMDSANAAFKDVGEDCGKAGAALSKFIDDNMADMQKMEAFEKTHPDVKKSVEDKYKDKTKAFEDQMGKLATKCKDDKSFMDAVKKMPG
jgi:hypothetical protein